MEKAIVTGSTGFIGSSFVDFLAEKGVSVLAVGRRRLEDVSPVARDKIRNATYVQIDMRQISQLGNRVRDLGWVTGNDCVFFNLSWGGKNSLSDFDVAAQMSNVIWSVDAIKIASELRCSKFIQIGTMEEVFTNYYLRLDHNKDKQYNRHVIYSVAKIAAKRALTVKAAELGIPFIYTLHSHVMGPDDGKDSFLQVTLEKLVRREELIFSSGEQLFDVISDLDCAMGYFLIGQKGVAGAEYWVGSGDPRRLREYVERMYDLFPSGQPMQFGALPYNDVFLTKEHFSTERLVADTGYSPSMSFEQTVQRLYMSLYPSKGSTDVVTR
jgi:nucleoside-diphosphate-sugar epimerase